MIPHQSNQKDLHIHVIFTVVEPGKPAWKKIKEAFGNDVILENGEINRAALGDIIFKNSEKRKRLNEITHPEIFKTMIWNCIYYLLTGYF